MSRKSKEQLRENHHRSELESAHSWRRTASRLLVSAQHLVRRATCLDSVTGTHDLSVLGPALLLRGLGIENLLKGLYVLRGGQLESGGKAGDLRPCSHHDLKCMANMAAKGGGAIRRDGSLIPTSEEAPMLAALQACTAHAGRYPIPRKPQDVVLHVGGEPDDRVVWSRDFEWLYGRYVYRLATPYWEGKDVHYAGKEGDPNPKTWRDLLGQIVEPWICRAWLDTGGEVGDRRLAPWAVVYR